MPKQSPEIAFAETQITAKGAKIQFPNFAAREIDMIGRGDVPRNFTFLIAAFVLAIGLIVTSTHSAVANHEWDLHQASQLPSSRASEPLKLRTAKVYKYEIPKAQRAPQAAPQSAAPALKSVPLNTAPPVINRGRYRGTPNATTRAKSRDGSFGGSCELCRNSCYVSYRVNSFSSQFVPCMHACWAQLCRR